MPPLTLGRYMLRCLVLLVGTVVILIFAWSFHAAFHPYHPGQYNKANLKTEVDIDQPNVITVGEQAETVGDLPGNIFYVEGMLAEEGISNLSSDRVNHPESRTSSSPASLHDLSIYSFPTVDNEASSTSSENDEPPYLNENISESYDSEFQQTYMPSATSAFSAPSATSTPLILYAYSDSAWAFDNLKFFLTHGVHSQATFLFIVNGAVSESAPPESIIEALALLEHFQRIHAEATIQVIPRHNKCYDMGAYGEILLADNSSLYYMHKHFILVNASVRGPLVPVWSRDCWSDAYLFPIVSEFKDEEGRLVKMVGMTQNCNWAGPNHVQSMVLAVDQEAMGILLGIIRTLDEDATSIEVTVDPGEDGEGGKPEDVDLRLNNTEHEDLHNFRNKVIAAAEASLDTDDNIAGSIDQSEAHTAVIENALENYHQPPYQSSSTAMPIYVNHRNAERRQSSSQLPHTADGLPIYNLALCPGSMWEAVHVEWSLTQLLLKHNYTATSMLALSHANHFSLSSAPGNFTCANGDVNAREGGYEGQDLHFWETMFIKVRWGVMTEAVDQTSKWLDRVAEGAWEQYRARQSPADEYDKDDVGGLGWGLRRGSWDVCQNGLLNKQEGMGR